MSQRTHNIASSLICNKGDFSEVSQSGKRQKARDRICGHCAANSGPAVAGSADETYIYTNSDRSEITCRL